MVENMVRELLCNRHMNFDKKFALVFNERRDRRDRRPLCYDGLTFSQDAL